MNDSAERATCFFEHPDHPDCAAILGNQKEVDELPVFFEIIAGVVIPGPDSRAGLDLDESAVPAFVVTVAVQQNLRDQPVQPANEA